MNKISKNKTRYALTLEKEDKKELEQIAKQENRSLNNLIETILKNYLSK
ncbi:MULTISPECIES: ribbon-helix-helix protein, CopG family [Staphylococcus]|nr:MULTISPECIES: ribbon-helix-helix protein, CopG family [Staphylococcus]MDT0739729.1 ribbon-helix-helix protein, CopG family [Staphylococcus chromogenes]QDW87818.1 DNA-binding protein [Staphylococcus hominis]